MRLALLRSHRARRLGAWNGDDLVDVTAVLDSVAPRNGSESADCPLGRMLAAGERGRVAVQELLAGGTRLPPDEVEWLPPLLGAERFICVGRNYLEHAEEAGRTDPLSYPVLFSRYWHSVVGHRQPLVRPHLSEELDFEGELAAVIGHECRYVSRQDALEVVGGYTIVQEGSVRDWQLRAPTQMAGKNFFASGAMGPSLVTADEIPDPAALSLRTSVNGETMQEAQTSSLIFDIPYLIEYITQFMPLAPGDVIATGTPAGVGMARTPARWLVPGDEVSVEISGIGHLVNYVIDEELP